MPRIKDTDVVAVREAARIDEVVGEVVTLTRAGGGSLKGLCPFHDERSPSFHVTPSKGFYHCFGCQEGGDVIDFVRKVDHLSFAEAVEKLAARSNITLHYEEGSSAPDRQKGQRTRLVEAHKAAAEFFVEQLATSAEEGATLGRTFLAERGFEAEAVAHFRVGYAPNSWDALTTHLRRKGFTDDELVTGGLAAKGKQRPYDRFRGRLVWPICDLSGSVIGFGARRLREDDDGPKYLNTPETPIYRKSQVLYGIDLARRDISKRQEAVIVEGYTDVMAAHLAGVTTAVATCGTAFGADHIKILRRLLMDQDEYRGQVIFTFDGDEAGKRAALKAFGSDQQFVAQTFVAIEPSGQDPCELRMSGGDEAVRELVARRVPLFEFAITATLAEYDLNTAEGRVAGLRAAAPVVAGIKDKALRPEYIRQLAGWLGVETQVAADAVDAAQRSGGKAASSSQPSVPQATQAEPVRRNRPVPDLSRTSSVAEREALKCAMQIPHHCASWYSAVESMAYLEPMHQAAHQAIVDAGMPESATSGSQWVSAVLDKAADDEVRSYLRECTVDPLHTTATADDDERLRDYAQAVLARLLELDATRRTVELKGRLQRTNPTTDADTYNSLFADLTALEQYRRSLRDRALGEADLGGVDVGVS